MIKNVLKLFKTELAGYRVFVFGSRRTGRHGRMSDIDVGVLGKSPLDATVFYRIEDAFERLPTLRRVEWIDLKEASPRFRQMAVQSGEVLYEG